MLTSHWMKAAALFVYIAAAIWVLNSWDRLPAPGSPTTSQPATPPKQTLVKTGPQLSPDALRRQEERRAIEEERARRQLRHKAREADLAAMIKSDLPAALRELAQAARRYRNKLSDLKHLTQADQWERETPVKEAHARAQQLTQEWYRIDLECQKEREGPTLHDAARVDELTKRILAFKHAGDDSEGFAAALPLLYGKVPESMVLSAIDAIPRAVLPQDAFDPCRRDPAACPKPVAVDLPRPEPQRPEPPPTPVTAPIGNLRVCANAAALRGDFLLLRAAPEPYAPAIARVRSESCRLRATGGELFHRGSGTRWIALIHDDGPRGWVNADQVRRAYSR